MSALRRQLRRDSPLPDRPVLTSHQRFIRSLPCLGCGKPAVSECACVGMLPKLGILPSDRYVLPLCGPATVWQDCCHSRKHYRGAARFWAELDIDPINLALQLWQVSGDVAAGLRAVTRPMETTRQHRPQDTERSASRFALDGRAALRPTEMAPGPMGSEFTWFLESRS